MCFTDKRKKNCIQKEDHVPDWVGYGSAGHHISILVLEPKFSRFYKMILKFL